MQTFYSYFKSLKMLLFFDYVVKVLPIVCVSRAKSAANLCIISIICFSFRLKNVSICIISAKMLFFIYDSKRQMGMATFNYPKMQIFLSKSEIFVFLTVVKFRVSIQRISIFIPPLVARMFFPLFLPPLGVLSSIAFQTISL